MFVFWCKWKLFKVLSKLKLRHYEKASKLEKLSHLFWQNSFFYSVASKQVGDFFKYLCPSQKSWTLTNLQVIFNEIDALFHRNNLTHKMRKSNEKSVAIFWLNWRNNTSILFKEGVISKGIFNFVPFSKRAVLQRSFYFKSW